MKTTLADLLKQEAQKVNNGFCYSTYPYPCFIEEALSHARHYQSPGNPTITHTDDGKLIKTVISIPPMKGSYKRKPFNITLYWMR